MDLKSNKSEQAPSKNVWRSILSSKKMYMSLALIVGLLLVSLLGYFLYINWDGRAVAKVGGEKITSKMVHDTASKFEKSYIRDGGIESIENINAEAQKIIIEEKVVLAESQKRGISVSDKDINDQFAADASQYPTVNEYLSFARSEYGWDEDQLKYRIKIDLLRNKLKDIVITRYKVDGYYVRYDVYNKKDLAGIESANKRMAAIRDEIIAGKNVDTIYQERKNDPLWKIPYSTSTHYDYLNDTADKENFKGREDWLAIKLLEEKADITPVVKSSGGYFAVYKLALKNVGQYDSWESFIDSFTPKPNFIETFLRKMATPAKAGVCSTSGFTGGSGCCVSQNSSYNSSNDCCNLNPYPTDRATFKGHAYNNVTKAALSGVAVSIDKSSNPSNLCSGAITTLGGSNYNETTNSDGYYTTGYAVNCWLHYDLTFSKTGYDTKVVRDINAPNGGTWTQDAYMYPSYVLTVVVNPANAATATNDQVSPHNNDGACEGSGKGCYEVRRAGYTSVASGYIFSGWSGACSGVAATYDVKLNGNKSCTAAFTPIPVVGTYTVTYNPNGATGGTVPVDSNAYAAGAPVTVSTNSGNLVRDGYTFDGWSTSSTGSMDRGTGTNFPMPANNVTLYAHWVVGCVNPTLELTGPTVTYTDPVDLRSRFTIPGYDSASGGSVVMRIAFADNAPGNGNKIIISDSAPTNIPASGIVEYTIPTNQDLSKDSDPTTNGIFSLVDGHTYAWRASVEISGSPTANGGAALCTTPVNGIVTIGAPDQQYFSKSPATTCSVAPTTADRPPLTSGITVSDTIPGAVYTVTVKKNNDVVFSKAGITFAELPYYYTFSLAGSYTIGIDMTVPAGYTKPTTLPCSANITVDSGTSGTGTGDGTGGTGEVAPN